MNELWDRIERWLATHAPVALDTLEPGASEADLVAIEARMGLRLPPDLRASLARHDGQNDTPGLFDGWRLLGVHEIVGEWNTYESDREDEEMFARFDTYVTPTRGIRDVYWNAKWIPIAALGSSDVVCVDTDATEGGTQGQVILRWKSGDRDVLSTSFSAWMERFADDLEQGKYEVDEDGSLEKK